MLKTENNYQYWDQISVLLLQWFDKTLQKFKNNSNKTNN